MEYSDSSYHQRHFDWTYKNIRYRTIFNPTGMRYKTYVKSISEWLYATNISGWKTIVTKKTAHKINGEINGSFEKLGVKIGGALKYEFTVEKTRTEEISMDLSSLNKDHRYKLCYWQDYLEYESTTYQYNNNTKEYDIKVTTVNKEKVTGKFNALFGEPSKHLMWGY